MSRCSSTYRAAYHVSYAGAEVGAQLRAGHFILRPLVGAGGVVFFGRTAVRRVERRDDELFFYVAPGVVAGYRMGSWEVGLDARLVMAPALRWADWAPAGFVVIGALLE